MSPSSVRIRVVLPAPLRPSSANVCPCGISSETSFKTDLFTIPLLQVLNRNCARIIHEEASLSGMEQSTRDVSCRVRSIDSASRCDNSAAVIPNIKPRRTKASISHEKLTPPRRQLGQNSSLGAISNIGSITVTEFNESFRAQSLINASDRIDIDSQFTG